MNDMRTADPYRDTSVIDARAPRFNQAFVATMAWFSVATGSWVPLLVAGSQLAIGLFFGRRYCLPCVFYFEVVQPRFGEGKIEDSRAPRFANIIGAVFLLSGALAGILGFPFLSLALGGVVGMLATLAVVTGLCVGCEMYKVGARLRGVTHKTLVRLDLADFAIAGSDGGGGDLVVEFEHPLCSDCQELGKRLEAKGTRVVRVDVSKRADLARKYGVAHVPLALRVREDGSVLGTV